jgi:hypothetical protein
MKYQSRRDFEISRSLAIVGNMTVTRPDSKELMPVTPVMEAKMMAVVPFLSATCSETDNPSALRYKPPSSDAGFCGVVAAAVAGAESSMVSVTDADIVLMSGQARETKQ